jgi:hypothetical protein
MEAPSKIDDNDRTQNFGQSISYAPDPAILSADVKGYGRLMEENELATMETLKYLLLPVIPHSHTRGSL